MALPITLDHEKLIMSLEKNYPKIDVRSLKSPDFNLTERELFFRLGQRALIDNLIDNLNKLKRGEQQ
jgi:hypothetical protein